MRLEFPGNFLGNFRKLETRKARPVLKFRQKRAGNFPYCMQLFPYPPPMGVGNRKLLLNETMQEDKNRYFSCTHNALKERVA